MVYLQGFDTKGRPLVYIIGQNIMWRLFSDNDLVKRFLVFVLDEAIGCMSPEQRSAGKITVLFDLSGMLLWVAHHSATALSLLMCRLWRPQRRPPYPPDHVFPS